MTPDPRLVAALHAADGDMPLLQDDCEHGRALAAFLADDRVRDWLAERLEVAWPRTGWTAHAYRLEADAILGRNER